MPLPFIVVAGAALAGGALGAAAVKKLITKEPKTATTTREIEESEVPADILREIESKRKQRIDNGKI